MKVYWGKKVKNLIEASRGIETYKFIKDRIKKT
jgi:hypothetical protein